MAMGKPVITTTSEDCRGVVEEGRNGILVPIKDSTALAEAIFRLMTDKTRRQSAGRYSRDKAVSEFDERPIIDQALAGLGVISRH
jgi:N,N'-diacetylbacillosaminyl-diphospho-undecaprenol alpha-1,3-N-acetylgalactosaminyltransferase